MNAARALFLEIRVYQWTKNLLVLTPLIFAGKVTEVDALGQAFLAIICFSFLSSAMYIANDIADLQADRNHPTKKYRPLASGALPMGVGICGMVLLLSSSFILSSQFLGKGVIIFLVAYFVLNIVYSQFLKKIPPFDILTVAVFYLLRPLVGAAAIDVPPSNWLILLTFFAALVLVSLKRYAELAHMQQKNFVNARKNIERYNRETLSTIATMSLGVTLVSYAIYANTFENYFILTIIPLTCILIRLIMLKTTAPLQLEVPERTLFSDRIIFLSAVILAGWILLYHL